MTQPFTGKVAFVTGAGSGIGAAVAKALAARGASVALFARRRDPLEKVAAEIARSGGDALVVPGDVSRHEDVRGAVASTVERFGALHLAVNNAGVLHARQTIPDLSIAEWNRTIGINLSGIFYGMKYEIPAMLSAGGGAIVNISSVFGDRAFPGNAAYVATKHAILGLTRTAAREFVRQNIRVNEIMPGLFDTEMTASEPEQAKQIASMVPLGRLGNVQEVAAAICFLLSDEASYITGTQLAVDGAFLT